MQSDEKRSIWTGLVALLAVGLVIGLVAGGVAFFGTRFVGLDESTDAGATDGPGASLEMPDPSPTDPPSGPQVTLPGGNETPSEEEESPTEEPSESETPEEEISLSAGQNAVSPGQQIDLTGVYPGGEGATLRVQRELDGAWVDFGAGAPIEATVSGETFSTFIVTSQTGENRFRMLEVGTEEASNPVTVTIG